MISVNRVYYIFFVFMLLGGMYFYNATPLAFIDEALVYAFLAFSFLSALVNKSFAKFKGLWITLAIFLFYAVYSLFFVKVTSKSAVLNDLIIQSKPFIAFFCTYALAPKFTDKQKNFLRKMCIALAVLMVAIFAIGKSAWSAVFVHPAYLGTNATILALTYYLCSNETTKDKIFTILILAAGFVSTRSKFYAFFVLAVFVLFWFKSDMLRHFKIKYVVMILLVLSLGLFVAREKITYYFITNDDLDTTEMSESAARAALYAVAPQIFVDYMPFGTGFGTYATYASGNITYSPIYEKYDLENVWGLREDKPMFVSDTFFPELAQFGVVGLIIYLMFIKYIMGKIRKSKCLNDKKFEHIGVLVILFVLIESVAGSSFIQGGGIMAMMLLAISIRELEDKNIEKG